MEGQEPTTEPEGQEPEGGQEPTAPEGKTFDESYVKSLRAENAKYRKEAQATAKALKDREDADKSELEKAQARVSELEQQSSTTSTTVQELRVENAVLREAANAGITDVRAAVKLLDWQQIDYDDDGMPKNVEPLLKELTKEYPGIVGKAPAPPADFDGGAREPAPANLSPGEAHNRMLVDLFSGKPPDQADNP